MSKRTIPANERVQVVTREMLDNLPLTIRVTEPSPDISVFGSEDDEGAGYPLPAGDEWCLEEGYDKSALGSDGLWMETDTANSGEIYVLKGVCIRRNPRVAVSTDVSSLPEPLDVSDATVTVDDDGTLTLDAASQNTLPTEQQSPVGVEDSAGTQVDPVDEASMGPYTDRVTATATYATISPGVYGDPATIVVDAAGAGTLTIEVSVDGGGTWNAYTVSYDSDGVAEEVHGYADVRAQADANLNALVVSAKGV